MIDTTPIIEIREDIKQAFDSVIKEVEPYIKHRSTEDWQAFIASLQRFGMLYEKELERLRK